MRRGLIRRVGLCILIAGATLSLSAGYADAEITQAQSELPTEALTITGHNGEVHRFTVEIARTPQEQEIGEMFRKHIAPDHGMLFLWSKPQESAMWMRNTFVPLDLVFIDIEHRIHAIEENAVPLSEGIISSHGIVGSVLELPGGTTERLGLVVGDSVESAAFGAKASSQ
ncbi:MULTISPECIES: DUF192 domain-containing protein [unclassified Saccharibacter]|uniref:DUF192 domain-containing protein n=1 Tax=unclassified Saccharibacter TaxID=2648722 RepID=UPI001326C764|nr:MULTISPECIES: DUF192 domain-containing protein [unclassified Saccharibacter]MXV36345.1 DUF192 domain-containing protein [Saccharibacter sp. EH611]MXV57507.1 DUF192 domain-containing protein [Saccharibacter sp. EH70]MXV65186.1 DUF192 domain-containing protein [Saccharibacter sp. EH60]